jgi:Domain of unknown function (DUF222)/HNH endonuclease
LQSAARDACIERVFDLIAIAGEDRSGWSASARLARLVELRAAQDRLDAEVLRAIGDCDAVDAWSSECLGAVSWLAHRAGLVRGVAARLVKTARFLRRHPRTAEALEAGEVTVPHVELLATAVHRRGELYQRDEHVLLHAAATVEVQDYPTAVRKWVSLADDELASREAGFAFDRRGVTLSPTTGGSAVSGYLDPEAAALVGEVLDEQQPPEGAADLRSVAQRRADALVLLCERARGGELADSRPIAGAELVVSHAVLARRPTADLDALVCEIEGFGPIPRITAERMVCDCAIARVVMGAEGEILDLGRRTRVIPPRLRRAIVVRDRRCQFPGCRAPAAWCDVHHLVHWLHGGETSLENCALLCRRHHVAVHEGGWKLVRGPTGPTLAA